VFSIKPCSTATVALARVSGTRSPTSGGTFESASGSLEVQHLDVGIDSELGPADRSMSERSTTIEVLLCLRDPTAIAGWPSLSAALPAARSADGWPRRGRWRWSPGAQEGTDETEILVGIDDRAILEA
jgi:hypothetical protein